jgi:hypothetical protein
VADRSRSHPGDITVACNFQVVIGRELAGCYLVKNGLQNTSFVFGPSIVLEWRNVKKAMFASLA